MSLSKYDDELVHHRQERSEADWDTGRRVFLPVIRARLWRDAGGGEFLDVALSKPTHHP